MTLKMTVKIGHKGLGLNILLPFLGILFLTMVQKVASSCGEHICLKWKIQDTKLVLICKVDALNFPITFYDPFNTETGFCVPHKPCISLLDKANITKNSSQHEFIFTIPLKMQLNGWWICTYGDNIDKSATEVTIQDIPSTNVQGGSRCWTLMMLWCFGGFSCSVLLVCFILFVLGLSAESEYRTNYFSLLVGTKYNKSNSQENGGKTTADNKSNSQENGGKTTAASIGVRGGNSEQPEKPVTDHADSQGSSRETHKVATEIHHDSQDSSCETKISATVVKRLILFILSVTLFVLPLIVGKTEEEDCVAPVAFAVYGAAVGIGSCCLLIIKETKKPGGELPTANKGKKNENGENELMLKIV